MEILCSFRLVLEGKTGNEIPESSIVEFLEKFLANNFALPDAEENTSGPLNRGGTVEITLLRAPLAICQKSQETSFCKVMNSCFSSLCKFSSFKSPFATITSLPELHFQFRRFILLIKMKKAISMNYGSRTSSWKPWRFFFFFFFFLICIRSMQG